jgi:hypothetical protein
VRRCLGNIEALFSSPHFGHVFFSITSGAPLSHFCLSSAARLAWYSDVHLLQSRRSPHFDVLFLLKSVTGFSSPHVWHTFDWHIFPTL